MAIQLKDKGLKINGLDVPGFTVLTGLSPNVEAALIQGGDATVLSQAPGLVPAFFTVAGGVTTLLKPDGSAFSGGAASGGSSGGGSGSDRTAYTLDGSNRIATETIDGLVWTRGYNAQGQPITFTAAGVLLVTATYDAAGVASFAGNINTASGVRMTQAEAAVLATALTAGGAACNGFAAFVTDLFGGMSVRWDASESKLRWLRKPAATWVALQTLYPNAGAALLALHSSNAVQVTDFAADFLPNAARTYWTVTRPTAVVFDTALSSGSLTGLDQVVKQAALPAGILRACKYFIVKVVFGKSGAVDAATSNQLRLGTAGSVADTAIRSLSVMLAGTRTQPFWIEFAVTAATTLMVVGPTSSGAWSGVSTGATGGATIAISSVDAALILSACVDMAGTTDTPQVFHLEVTLMP